MSKVAHTPGPWHRDRESGVRCDVRSESGRKIALCWGLSTSRAAQANSASYRAECDANARLIAAAPELLEALRQLEMAVLHNGDWDDGCFYHNGTSAPELQRPLDDARAAIAKVEGRQT